ncbi:hypothetical protein PR048_028518 [Dryococelus australis]|uniref:Uncharacterized protein n=1 Tax=Dryococelus australis TaxID=614101 RepID=A0ABQ9GAT2_9NEOP|nr:hypothetical protein PR048_028518 [Dryococelus australis]
MKHVIVANITDDDNLNSDDERTRDFALGESCGHYFGWQIFLEYSRFYLHCIPSLLDIHIISPPSIVAKDPMRVIEVNMERSRNERAVETGDPRGNLPTSGIVRHESHMQKPGVTRPGIEPGSP